MSKASLPAFLPSFLRGSDTFHFSCSDQIGVQSRNKFSRGWALDKVDEVKRGGFFCIHWGFDSQREAMAGGMMVAGRKGRSELYGGRVTPYVVFACIVAAVGGSLFGYDLGVSGGVTSMDDFLKKFFPDVYRRKRHHLHETDYCKYDDQLLTLFTSSLYIAGLLSTYGASFVSRNYGRRISILAAGTTFLAGAVLNAAAQSLTMLIIGRLLLGVGVGFGNQAVPLYLSEMAPARIRGALNLMFQLTTCVGILCANVLNYFTARIHPWGWRLSLGTAAVPALVMTVGGFFLPETPNSLVEQGRLEEGRIVLEKIRGTKNIKAELDDLVEASEIARSVKHPFRNLLQRKHRPQLVMAMFIPAFQQLTGINSILFYAPVIFQSLGFGSDAALYSSIVTGAVITLATLVSIATVDRWGRRLLFMEAGIQMILCQVIMSALLALKFGKGETLPTGYAVSVVIMICLFVGAFGWSWGPLGWLVPSEIFPLETRSAGQSITVCVNLLFTFGVAQSFLALLCNLKYGIFLLFAGLEFVMTAFVYLFLPETKSVPIEEMKLEWEKHWFWKAVVADYGEKPGLPASSTGGAL